VSFLALAAVLAWLLIAPRMTSFVLLVATVVFDVFLFPVLLAHVTMLAVAGLALAFTWWRVPSTDVAAVALESAGVAAGG
jgi:multidrug resistance efflux pump